MKLQKIITLLMSLALLTISVPVLSGAQPDSYDAYKYQQLLDKAKTRGLVRVLVEMNVPDIEVLTALSTQYRTGQLDRGLGQTALNADLQLESAISGTRHAVLHQLNGTSYYVKREFSTLPAVALAVSPEGLDRLRAMPEVKAVLEDELIPVPEHSRSIDGETPDPALLGQSISIVGADSAWGFGYDGSGWYVAVLDTGLRNSHEMFQGKNTVEHCFSSGEGLGDSVGDCPNGLTEMGGPGSAAPYAPQYGHGTHVAGIAVGNNNSDRFGVARGAGIMAIQVFSFFTSYNDVLSWSSDQLSGLEWVYLMRNTYNIASVNMSLGGSDGHSSYCPGSSRALAVSNLRAAGIATTIASGNESRCGQVSDPACVPDGVTIGGSDKSDNYYNFGNWDDVLVDLLAPGVGISSADSNGDSVYGNRSGTSMSAPHVAGAWAIMKQFDPNLSVDDILVALQGTGFTIDNTRCSAEGTRQRINVADALTSLFSLSPPLNLTAEQETNKSFLQTEYVNVLRWEANPLNANKNIVNYRVYEVADGNQLNLLTEVNNATFTYWHRKAGKRVQRTYAVSAVNGDGDESPPYYYTITFGTTSN
ncbi:MAG: S8 family serine peptidase [bacterium]|nr:S8 family serine peptidase [bacterium]